MKVRLPTEGNPAAQQRKVENPREYPVPDAAAARAENRIGDFQKRQVRFCKKG